MQLVGSVLRDCSSEELLALVNPVSGIASRCSWPPTLNDFAKFRQERRDKIIDRTNFDERYPRRERQPVAAPVRTPFRPYPKLWEAFAAEPEIIEQLDNRGNHPLMNFDQLTQASKLLAMRGIDEAREYILTGKTPKPHGYAAMIDEMSGLEAPDLPAREFGQ